MKTNERMKVVALIAVVVLLIGGGLIYWQYSARGEAQTRVASLQAELPDADQVNTDLVTSQQELEAARIQLEHLERALPESAYIPTLLKELEMLGTSKNVKITGIRPILEVVGTEETGLDDSGYQKLDIDITGTGTYRAMLEMISALKDFPKILAVNTINMQPKQGAEGAAGDLDATIRLRAFVFKEPLPPVEGSTEDLRQRESGEGSEGDAGTGTDGSGSTIKTEGLDTRRMRKDVAL